MVYKTILDVLKRMPERQKRRMEASKAKINDGNGRDRHSDQSDDNYSASCEGSEALRSDE
jgi:hypothetical protein